MTDGVMNHTDDMPDTTPPLWALLVGGLAASVALFIACEPPDGDDAPRQPPSALTDTGCIADDECVDDDICIDGLCSIDPPDGPLTYGLVATPPNSSTVPPHRLSVDDRPVAGATVTLEETERVDGRLETANGESAPDGTLLFDPLGDTAPREIQRPVRDGDFDVRLPPDDYRVEYLVDDPRWPPIPVDTLEIDDSFEGSIDWSIPEFADLRSVTGVVNRQLLDIADLLDEPVESAAVIAERPDSEHRTRATVTDEDGEFTLVLPPGEDDFDVLVRPGPDNPLAPHVRFDGELDATTDDLSLSVGELDLADLVTLSVEATAPSINGQQPDWDAYRVEIQRDLDVGELLVTPALDGDGHTEIELPIGSYDIEIIPPVDAPWSGTSESIDILDALGPIELELSVRPRIDATVTDSTGEPLAGVRVEPKPANGGASLRPAISDAEGEVSIWLEPGDYELVFRPPAASNLPWHRESLTVGTDGASDTTFEIPRGFVATGTLTTADNRPIPNAYLRAFDTGSDGTPRTVGDARTDSGGDYRLLLSPDVVDD